jgi:hypothetical protein
MQNGAAPRLEKVFPQKPTPWATFFRFSFIMGIWDHRGLGRVFMSLIFIIAGVTQISEFEEMRKVVW